MLSLFTGTLLVLSIILMIYYVNAYTRNKDRIGRNGRVAEEYLSKSIKYTLLSIFLFLLFVVLVKVY